MDAISGLISLIRCKGVYKLLPMWNPFLDKMPANTGNPNISTLISSGKVNV